MEPSIRLSSLQSSGRRPVSTLREVFWLPITQLTRRFLPVSGSAMALKDPVTCQRSDENPPSRASPNCCWKPIGRGESRVYTKVFVIVEANVGYRDIIRTDGMSGSPEDPTSKQQHCHQYYVFWLGTLIFRNLGASVQGLLHCYKCKIYYR